MAEGDGCIVHAGIIDDKCKLTQIAKDKFIKQMKEELTFGTEALPTPPLFPCGPPVPPNQFAKLLELEDEEKFANFHANILGAYQKIACALNMQSDFKILPICDPVALAFKLGIDFKIEKFPSDFIPFFIPNPPLLALKLNVMPPPKIIAKFPSIPTIPPPIPKFDIPPNLKMPDFKTLFEMSISFITGIPKLILDLVAQMPQLVLKLASPPDLFKFICDLAFKANIFGPINATSTTQIVAVKVLTTKVVEMALISAIGTTIGSAPSGITGGLGKLLGYVPPSTTTNNSSSAPNIREKITSYALELDGTGYGADTEKQDKYASRLLSVEYPEPSSLPQPDPRAIGKIRTLQLLKTMSSCGLVARACLAAAGASYVFDSKVDTSKQDPSINLYYDFFLDRYKTGTAIAGIASAARAKEAIIEYKQGDLPALKKGDIIIVSNKSNAGSEHVIVLVEDYEPGSFSLTTIEGGQRDDGNDGRPTYVKKNTYVQGRTVPKDSGNVSMYLNNNNEIVLAGRTVYMLIDGEKLCTNTKGSDMTKSNGPISLSLNDSSGFGFQELAE